MFSQGKMNALAVHKRLIIEQSDSHRRVIEGEGRRIALRMAQAREFVHQKRWWLLGGTAVVGFLLAPSWKVFWKLLPLIPDVVRTMRRA